MITIWSVKPIRPAPEAKPEQLAPLKPAMENWPFPSSDPQERYRMMMEHQELQRDWLRHEPEGMF